MVKVLIVLTSHDTLGPNQDSSVRDTGLWLEEFATPYYIFDDAKIDMTIASPLGGPVPIDQESLAGDRPKSVIKMLEDQEALTLLKNSKKLDSIADQSFDAIFLPGGHGTMWDLPTSEDLAQMISMHFHRGALIAAVCHGPAGLVNAVDSAGDPIVKGREVTAFSNSEEEAVGLTQAVPFLLETMLNEFGAKFKAAKDFEANTVIDGNLITGQNPASSEGVAKAIIDKLEARTGSNNLGPRSSSSAS